MDGPLVLTRDEVLQVDRIAIDELGVPGAVLMENAGRGVAEVLLALDPSLRVDGRQDSAAQVRDRGAEAAALRPERHARISQDAPAVAILCGKGNNAGDGFVVARHLELLGVSVVTLLLLPPTELAGDARLNYDILVRSGSPLIDISAAAGFSLPDLTVALDQQAGRAKWLIDALLGTGATGAPREPLATAIAWMNGRPARRLAIDIPSGIDCDTGEAPGVAVRADVTCTFVAAKPGLVGPEAADCVGQLHVVSVGAPWRAVDRARRG